MQDLTFGEQVKIILSRKDMTIKELARKIEGRTGKKMSRQNMTQRLGRDNFQERDMRMIAEILGCPFYLNILDDSMQAEKAGDEAEAGQRPETDPKEKAAAQTEGETEAVKDAELSEPKETADSNDKPDKPKETADSNDRPDKPKETADSNDKPDKPRESGCEPGPESGKGTEGMANERDITIGELVEIHKKLDVLENSVGKASSDAEKDAGTDIKEQVQRETASIGNVEAAEELTEHGPCEHQTEQGQQEDSAVQEKGDGREQAADQESHEEYNKEMKDAPVEKLLEEIESLEMTEKKEEKPEEKPHGWRAYFKQRFKKIGKENTIVREESESASHSAANQAGKRTEAVYAGNSNAGNEVRSQEYTGADSAGYQGYAGTDAAGYQGYAGPDTSGYRRYGEADAAGYQGYAGEDAAGYQGYAGEDTAGYQEYARPDAAGYQGYAGPDTAGYQGYEGAGAADYEGYAGTDAAGYEGYGEAGAAGYQGYKDTDAADYGEYGYEGYGYGEEEPEGALPEEEDTERGELNPYTGQEYESNSVRMHPSRIGYVQVYDRENHQWTDMTEWAFLGYQERKKQLLGKDYDPPIYLD